MIVDCNQPLITVYVPTHNRRDLLERALRSILEQTYENLDVIIVDDGSSDSTREFMEQAVQKYDQVSYFRHDSPKGACAARNLALSKARGEFVTGLDDDDEFLPNHIEGLYRSFKGNYSFVAACLLEDNGTIRIERRLDCGEIGLDSLLHYNKVGNQVFTKTNYMLEIGGFDVEFPAFQDYDTWVRLVDRFGPGLKVEQATYVWHTSHEKDRISNFPHKRLNALSMFIDKHQSLMSKNHHDSLAVMRIRMAGEPFPFRALLKRLNRGNWKASVALFLNSNFSRLKTIIDNYRHS